MAEAHLTDGGAERWLSYVGTTTITDGCHSHARRECGYQIDEYFLRPGF
jgi:hypothetical protein